MERVERVRVRVRVRAGVRALTRGRVEVVLCLVQDLARARSR